MGATLTGVPFYQAKGYTALESHAVPLAKTMWDGILFRWDPAISAISTLQIGITITVLVVVGLLRRRSALGAFDV